MLSYRIIVVALSLLVVMQAVAGEDQGQDQDEDRHRGRFLRPNLRNVVGTVDLDELPTNSASASAVPDRVPDSYIVWFNSTDSGTDIGSGKDLPAQARDVVVANGGRVGFTYTTVLNGDQGTAEKVRGGRRGGKRTAYDHHRTGLHRDQESAQHEPLGAGPDRRFALALDGKYSNFASPTAGQGVHVYVIDTGIAKEYDGNQLIIGGGRNFIADSGTVNPDNWTDCEGHGTHVAGTVASKSYGVAPGAIVYGVRVLSCTGSGTYAGVIAGVNWVASQVSPGKKVVANMSLGGPKSDAMNTAIQNAVTAGVLMVVAAGNENMDACTKSPASAGAALTVGSTTRTDARSSFSNFGTCVDIWGPGSSVLSIVPSGSTAVYSGTSMASPHVAGAAALFYETAASRADAVANLMSMTIPDKITNVQVGSPNRLVQVPQTSYVPQCDASTSCPDDNFVCEFGQCVDNGGGSGGTTPPLTSAPTSATTPAPTPPLTPAPTPLLTPAPTPQPACCGGGVSGRCDAACCRMYPGSFSIEQRDKQCTCLACS